MSNADSHADEVADLARDYLERCRGGERPSLGEYIQRFPHLEEQIRDVFPMMLLMEDIAPPDDPNVFDDVQLEQLGDFKIHRIIGRGGMGVVYEATQESLGRRVALKVCPLTRGMSSRNRERFRRESRSAAMLHHTNIAPVFAVGEENGMLYYSMQFIEGATLDDVIDELKLIWKSTPTATTRLATGYHTQARTTADRQQRTNLNTASNVAHSIAGTTPPDRNLTDIDEASSEKHADARLNGPAQKRPDERGTGQSAAAVQQSDSSSVHAAEVHLPGQSTNDSGSKVTAKYWESIGRIGVQVSEALAYAHGRGTLHRDIKPGNLMLDQSGTVWVLDFGLAKSEEEDDLTQDGELIGTLRYMAPEQARGAPTALSDVYSLGLTLYELLTLRPAFDEVNRSALLKAISDSEPIAPRRLNSHVPRDLETIVLKAIEREPARRYATAQEMADDLNRFLDGEPIHARPVKATERVGKWVRRRPLVAALLTALATLFVASFVLISWKWREAEFEREQAIAAADAEKEATASATRLRALAEQRLKRTQESLYRSAINRVQATSSTDTQNAKAILSSLIPTAGEADYRDWEWGYLNRLVNQSVATLPAGAPEAEWIRALAFSHDDALLAVGSARPYYVRPVDRSPSGRVTIWNVGTGKLVRELPIEHSCIALAFSRDGSKLAVSEPQAKHHIENEWRGPAYIYDVETAQPIVKLEMPPWSESPEESGARVTDIAFSNDDRLVIGTVWAKAASPEKVSIWDARTGRELWHIDDAWLIEAETEGETFTVVRRRTNPNRMARYSLESREEIATLAERLGAMPAAPSSRHRLNAQCYENRLQLHNYTNGKFLLLYGDDDSRVTNRWPLSPIVDYHPVERRLVAGTTDGSLRFWQPDLGTSEGILRGHSIDVQAVAYSHSGRLLASGDWLGEVRLWEPDAPAHQVTLRTRDQRPDGCLVEDIAFQSGSDNLVAMSLAGKRQGKLTLWESETGLLLEDRIAPLAPIVEVFDKLYRQAQVSQDGRMVLSAAPDGQLQLTDVQTGEVVARSARSTDLFVEVALSGDGNRFASVRLSPLHADVPEQQPGRDAFLEVWQRDASGSDADQDLLPMGELQFGRAELSAIALDDSGRFLAAAVREAVSTSDHSGKTGNFTNSRVLLWDVDAGDAVLASEPITIVVPNERVSVMDFSTDGKSLAICHSSGMLRIFSTETGEPLTEMRTVPEGIEGLDWHPNGNRLAGGNREVVTIWDRQGEEVLQLRGPPRYGDIPFDAAVKFSPDGIKLAATQWNNTVLVWSAAPLETSANRTQTDAVKHSTTTPIQRRDRSTERGLASLSRTVESAPRNPWFTAARGYLHSAEGNSDAALEDYLAAKQLLAPADDCLLIDSQSYIRAPSIPFDLEKGYTIEAWVKQWNSQAVEYLYGVIAAQYPLGPNDRYAYEAHQAKWDLDPAGIYWLRPVSGDASAEQEQRQQWTHYAVTINSDSKTFYTNGQPTAKVRRTRSVNEWSDFYIGTTEFQNPAVKGQGLIRSLRVSMGEVVSADVANESTAPPEHFAADDSTLLLYDFTIDDGVSTDDPRTITDRSGNERHGTLHNAWWISD